MTEYSMEKIVAKFIALRDEKKVIAARHSKEMSSVNEQMETIKMWMQREFLHKNIDGVKTKAGSAFIKTNASVKILDWDAALNFMKDNDMYHLLEHRLSKTGVEEYLEAQGEEYPGTKITRTQEVQFRR